MADPQIENGYTKIANEFLEAFHTRRITGREWQVLTVIIRETYGFNRKETMLTTAIISARTGLSKAHVCHTIKSLEDKNIIAKIGNAESNILSINKNFETWLLPKSATLPKMATTIAKIGNGNKDLNAFNVVKETVKKPNTSCSDTDNPPRPNEDVPDNQPPEQPKNPRRKNIFEEKHLKLARLLWKHIKANNPKAKKPTEAMGHSWANTFRKMEQIDGYSIEDIREVLEWSQRDNFWSGNILSAGKLREQWNMLTARMGKPIKKKVSPTAIVDKGPDKTQVYLQQAKDNALPPEEQARRARKLLEGIGKNG